MNTTARRNNALVSARPANDRVTLEDAHRLHATDGTTYPVSGDATMVGYGTIGFRRASTAVDLWTMPGVVPKIKTQGIKVGSQISTWYGDITVTRVGTIAGFGIDSDGEEVRWTIEEVREIL